MSALALNSGAVVGIAAAKFLISERVQSYEYFISRRRGISSGSSSPAESNECDNLIYGYLWRREK